jgi:hypothetical protein
MASDIAGLAFQTYGRKSALAQTPSSEIHMRNVSSTPIDAGDAVVGRRRTNPKARRQFFPGGVAGRSARGGVSAADRVDLGGSDLPGSRNSELFFVHALVMAKAVTISTIILVRIVGPSAFGSP